VEARAVVEEWMTEAGLDPTVDAATNLVGRRRGASNIGAAVATGSHLDTVVDAGPFDGAYGVVAAVEVASALVRSGSDLYHDLMVVAFANEEGARGTRGMVGSRAVVRDVHADELALPDDDGVALAQRLHEAGGDPEHIASAAWSPGAVAAFVELHIEQGPVLDTADCELGVVTAIAGRLGVDIDIIGAANHAGTTPMHLRHDALTAAADVVLAVEKIAHDRVVRVATVGHINVGPNVRNVVPGRAIVSAELRDEDATTLLGAKPEFELAIYAIAERRGLIITVTWGQYVPPATANHVIVDVIRREAKRSGRSWRELTSGAGHDAQIVGREAPIGMIFVPSIGGISHAPEERTHPAHLVTGAQLLLDAMLAVDDRLANTSVAETP
jgi:N-carbamoyl-L-amino-acid hydrolase